MSSGDGGPIKRSDRPTRMRAQRAPNSLPADGGASVAAEASGPASGPVQAPAQTGRLVFGLNPRAHRAQKARTASAGQTDGPKERAASPITSKYTGSLAADTRAGKSAKAAGESGAPAARPGQIRASKYGNYYKPQDLTSAATDRPSRGEQVVAPAAHRPAMTKSSTSPTRGAAPAPSSAGPGQPAAKQTTGGGGARERARNEPPATGGKATGARPNSVRSTSRSPDRAKPAARRKSFDEDISTLKLEPSPVAQQLQQPVPPPQPPVLKSRTQFNILPPPQLTIATTGKGSVVGYAKSRIYDRPVRQILANPPESTYSALDDRTGQIPASILSGFKPPKQVNVSKAREKWEGGEPFAKCKSRKRLAAQANKKLFPGTWSMTSVVATQQLHLQQALAQSASSANHRSNPLETDPSVKVLTRGSVLERVQLFEKAPTGGGGPVVGLADDADSPTGGPLDGLLDGLLDSSSQTSSDLSRSSSVSSTDSLGSDGGATVRQPASSESSSKQAQYKSRVSSIQQQQQRSAPETTNGTPVARPSSASVAGTAPGQQRRISLRRRSSMSRSSTESLIPRFYHPNGKPNTYEIEVRKRDILACFDKLPKRRAQVSSGSSATSRRHFNLVAAACGYSEYFKVPLQLFVAHKLATDQKVAQLSAASQQARQRKSSTVALDLSGSSSNVPLIRSLVKAASVDSNPSDSADPKEVNFVNAEQFLSCWRDLISRAYDHAAQFIHLLTLGQRGYLAPDDFVPLVQSVIDDHPGLKFLRAAPDFHMRYIQTVIARIYYNVNRSWTGKITLQELRKSNLLAVLTVLGQEDDINQITDYFSYEHFYVIYCKFWNLDQDHDLFISKEDLARHYDGAISSRIIERIFSGIVSKQIQQTGRMSYSDFVWFLIAEEDKKHPRSIEYWFRLMDLDGDGYISMYEMEYFYYEQTKRLEIMNIEALPFLDSACQILDLVNPKEKNKISLADLKRTKMATIFFDTFINLEKYLEHESREFVSTRDVVQGGVVISDWDRYASEEYENLVTEESTV